VVEDGGTPPLLPTRAMEAHLPDYLVILAQLEDTRSFLALVLHRSRHRSSSAAPLSRTDVACSHPHKGGAGKERKYGGNGALTSLPLFPDTFLGSAGSATVPLHPFSPVVGCHTMFAGDNLSRERTIFTRENCMTCDEWCVHLGVTCIVLIAPS
jgi:hypothetical protein